MPTVRPPGTRAPRRGAAQRRLRPPLTAVAALALTTGCFTYQPASFSDLTPESNVRLQLTAPAVERLRNGGNNEGRLLEGFALSGTLNRVTPDSLVVSVPTATVPDPGARSVTFFQPVALTREDVRQPEVRVLDRQRTTIMGVVLGALTIAAAVYAIDRGGTSTGTTPTPGGPSEVRLPLLLRWSIR